jgi:hypothetical protein
MNDKDKDVELGRKLYRVMQEDRSKRVRVEVSNKAARFFVGLVVVLLLISYGLHIAGAF